STTFKPYSPS
ncbi:hypothetical protein D043_1938B, partial [Vibrio parahaemolyticus EKP-021]